MDDDIDREEAMRRHPSNFQRDDFDLTPFEKKVIKEMTRYLMSQKKKGSY